MTRISAHFRMTLTSKLLKLASQWFPLNPQLSNLRKLRGEQKKRIKQQVRSKSGLMQFLLRRILTLGLPSPTDTWQGGGHLPMPTGKATTIDVSGAEKYVDEFGSSIPVRADAGFESNGFTSGGAAFHVFVKAHTGLSKPLVFPCVRFCVPSTSDSAFSA